ncbi:MAG TPA: hypothetical protein VN081_02405 [Dongiaceae bacterium]|nr:hypothetical protein [Dongiaceae bacterium]
MNKRDYGYYWVKKNGKWQIAELLDGDRWWLFGYEWAQDETVLKEVGSFVGKPSDV